MGTDRAGSYHIRPGKDNGSLNWNGHYRDRKKTKKTFRLNPHKLIMD